MWFNFSKIEILVLQKLCEASASPGAIAAALGKKGSFISRAIARLLEKGMVEKNRREISLSQAAHAQSFKRLYDSRPNAKIEKWLCKSAMDALIVLAGFEEGADTKTIAEEVFCSKPTMFKVLKALYSAGVAGRSGKGATISDRLAREFAQSYANSIHLLLLAGAKGHNVSIRVRKSVVVRTDAKEVPQFFCETGINALQKFGMSAMKTSYSDYFFTFGMEKKNISPEEAFVHALLLTTIQQHQDKTVLAIFLHKSRNGLNIGKLRELAKKFNVIGELDTMRQALDYVQKMR